MWRLKASFTDGRTQDIVLPLGEITVGRTVNCGLILDDPSVSRQHAKITVRKVGVDIEDLQSSNGIIFNGKRVAGRILLQSGDEVNLGTVKLTLERQEDEEDRTVLFGMEEADEEGSTLPEEAEPGSSALEKPSPPTSADNVISGLDLLNHDLQEDAALSGSETGAASKYIGLDRENTEAVHQGQQAVAKLLIYPEGASKETYYLSKDVINVGRSDENDIIIDHGSVSRFHAKIITQGQNYFLLDLDSANGTRANNRPVTKHKLQHWDEIYFGSVMARFADRPRDEITSVRPAQKKSLNREESVKLKILLLLVLLFTLIIVLLITR